MKIIITESQHKVLTENKLLALQKLVDSQITDKYDFVCKVVITPPHHYNVQHSAHVYFKDMNSLSMNVPKYFKMKEDVMNEVWDIIYNFTNETVSLYQKHC